jgi:hypothetical protein
VAYDASHPSGNQNSKYGSTAYSCRKLSLLWRNCPHRFSEWFGCTIAGFRSRIPASRLSSARGLVHETATGQSIARDHRSRFTRADPFARSAAGKSSEERRLWGPQ